MHKNEKRSGKLYAHYPDLTYHRMDSIPNFVETSNKV